MTITLTVTEAQTFQALGDFLVSVLPPGVDVLIAQVNRVPETSSADFVMMNTIEQKRLATNTDAYADALFTGSIAGTTLTITNVSYGTIAVGSPVLGVGVTPNTYVAALGTGTGGTGTYTINNSQTITSRPIACGAATKLQPMEVTVQLDVHGPASADNAAIITGMLRDEYGVEQFHASGFDVTPLYASDARQLPFVNENQQIEQRWVIDAVLQCNPVLTVPQEFADSVTVGLVEVDAVYPPA